jgi:hypothetical protein
MVDKLPYATVGGLKKVVLVPSRGLGLSGWSIAVSAIPGWQGHIVVGLWPRPRGIADAALYQ